MKDGTLRDAKDIETLLKEQFKDVIEEMLETVNTLTETKKQKSRDVSSI